MTDEGFWQTERRLWLGSADVARRWIARESLLVFPEPVGILSGPTVIENLSPSPRWERIDFMDGALRRIGTDAAVLAYVAEAVRIGGQGYRALCSSTWVRQAGDWCLVQHQQTPS